MDLRSCITHGRSPSGGQADLCRLAYSHRPDRPHGRLHTSERFHETLRGAGGISYSDTFQDAESLTRDLVAARRRRKGHVMGHVWDLAEACLYRLHACNAVCGCHRRQWPVRKAQCYGWGEEKSIECLTRHSLNLKPNPTNHI